jgi:hypothetical protein
MFIKPVIVSELPQTNRGHSNPISSDQADEFFRTLVMADGAWMKFYEATASKDEVANARHLPRNFIFSAAMRKYRHQIEYTTKYYNGVIMAYARLIK